jgi:hypothetical protein
MKITNSLEGKKLSSPTRRVGSGLNLETQMGNLITQFPLIGTVTEKPLEISIMIFL